MPKREEAANAEAPPKKAKIDETFSDFHIFDLNDDSLINVLSFLEFDDILKLFEVHSRFHAAIAANLKDLVIEIPGVDDIDQNQMEHFLAIFGGKVRKLKLWCLDQGESHQAMELITKYCNAGNVEHCEFDEYYEFSEDSLENNLNFLRGLKSLRFQSIDVENEVHDRMLAEMVRLEHLNAAYYGTTRAAYRLLPKLQSLQLKSLFLECPKEWTAEFEHWPRFDSLTTLGLDTSLMSKDLAILRCFPNLVDMRLSIDWEDGYPLNLLEVPASLKRLRLTLSDLPCSEVHTLLMLLANQNTLEHLDLDVDNANDDLDFDEEEANNVTDSDIIAVLNRFTKLKSLRLCTQWEFRFQLLNLAESLTELRSLVIDGNELNLLNPPKLEQLVCEIVISARNLNRIDIDFDMPSTTTNEYYHRLYEKVSLIRSKQASKVILKIRIRDYSHKMYVEENKSVILEVRC